MTLNITVLTSHCIYQSADYRLLDLQTNTTTDFQTQKIFVVNAFKWSATVCFTGVGRTHGFNVHEWLSEKLGLIQMNDPFERLIDELVKAESWLSRVPAPHNKHSFSVGAFLGTEPVFALVSNFERPSGLKAARASRQLSVFEVRVNKPKVFVAGQTQAVTRHERRRLRALAARNPAPERMHSVLAEVNRGAATRTNQVSSACFTTHLHLTGEGDARAHDVGNAPLAHPMAMPVEMREAIMQVADDRFGPGRWRVKSTSFVRADASDEYHKTQLREKPDDPSVHSNYGAFLKDKKGDLEGAEREYRRAIELDPNHVNALGNLANLVSEKGDGDQAAGLYRKALEVDRGNEHVTWNFANFLVRELDDRIAARDLLDRGILANPESGRLLMRRAEFSLGDGSSLEALEGFQQAREKRANQARVEAGYAYALHMSGAPVGECIAAYHVATALNPENGALWLNLAQLLFLKDDGNEAGKKLDKAIRLGLDESAQLEALFYRLCHTLSDPAEIFRATKALLTRGARLRWNIQPNIETVRRRELQKSVLLEQVSKVMAGEQDQILLDEIFTHWPSADSGC